MLMLQAPVERDNIGYNKADYNAMENIGMLNTTPDLAETVNILQALRRYTSTQLPQYKDEILTAYEHYSTEFKEKYPDVEQQEDVLYNSRCGGNHQKADYIKRELIFVSADDDNAIVKFREYVENVNLRGFKARWCRLPDGSSGIQVPFDTIDDFLKYVSNRGKYGYQAPQELIDAITLHRTATVETREKSCFAVLLPTNEKNMYGYDVYELSVNNYDFNQKLWQLKNKALKYVDSRRNVSKAYISTNSKMLGSLLDFLRKENVDVSRCEQLKETAGQETDKSSNNSNNTLIDISSLELPFTPYPFQIEDAEKIVRKKKALLGHDMGCGKTFISALVGMSINGAKLVVCPETLRLNWERELTQAHKGADIKIIYSKDKDTRNLEQIGPSSGTKQR